MVSESSWSEPMKVIPNYVPSISGNEKKYLVECIDSGWVSPVGPFVDRFEADFAKYHGVSTAAAVGSGTGAIHLSMIAMGVRKGDYVLLPTITFIGSANPIKYCGADPIFLDVEEKSLNVDPQKLHRFIQEDCTWNKKNLLYKKDGRRIAALLVVHLYGNVVAMDEVLTITKKYNLPVIEDAAESLGARYQNRLAGTFADMGCFSFNGNKIVTTGGGGMIIAKDPEKTKLCKHLSTQAKTSTFGFIHDRIGYNYRLSNLCAAVGVAQFEQLDTFIQAKREQAKKYQELFSDSSAWEIIFEPPQCFGTYWMVLARYKCPVVPEFLKKIEELAKSGIGVRPIWHPLHLMPLFKNEINHCGSLSYTIYHSTVCLPSSVGLTDGEIEIVAQALKKFSLT